MRHDLTRAYAQASVYQDAPGRLILWIEAPGLELRLALSPAQVEQSVSGVGSMAALQAHGEAPGRAAGGLAVSRGRLPGARAPAHASPPPVPPLKIISTYDIHVYMR